MSKFINLANAVIARLETSGADGNALYKVPVMLAKQKDLDTQIASAVGKMKVCVLVYPTIAKRKVVAIGEPFAAPVVCEVYGSPLLSQGSAAPDDVAEAVALSLDGWMPPGSPVGNRTHPEWQMVVEEFGMMEDPVYLAWKVGTRTNMMI